MCAIRDSNPGCAVWEAAILKDVLAPSGSRTRASRLGTERVNHYTNGADAAELIIPATVYREDLVHSAGRPEAVRPEPAGCAASWEPSVRC